jgi:hypothetical protein
MSEPVERRVQVVSNESEAERVARLRQGFGARPREWAPARARSDSFVTRSG